MALRKQKVSLSLPADLVDWVDRQAARYRGTSRSGIIEQALRAVARRTAVRDLEDATTAYYQSLSEEEREEDASWARAAEDGWRRRKG